MNQPKFDKKFALKWILIAIILKGLIFTITAILFNSYWDSKLITNSIFIASGDTQTYYKPIESFVLTGNYDSYCRMPGLLPIYGPLYFLFGEIWGKTFVILFQFIAGAISVYSLSVIAAKCFNNIKLFYFTFFIYSFSTFVSNWDHYGLSDSFSISFVIFSLYYIIKYKDTQKNKTLLIASLFLTWAIFFRPINGILFPLFSILYLINLKNIITTIKKISLFSLPLIIFISIWTYSNYNKYNKIIPLQGPINECFGSYTPEMLSIRELIISWGGDYQPWSKNSEASWFFSNLNKKPNPICINNRVFTSKYNYDSLLNLRQSYINFNSDTISEESKQNLSKMILKTSNNYTADYKKEKPFSYYFLNKLIILKQLIIPSRLDDFPTPSLDKMKWYHKLLKGGYYLLLLIINSIGLLVSIYLLLKKQWIVLIPLSFILLIGPILGFVEQRYIAPSYPYLCILFSYLLISILDKFKNFKLQNKDLKS